MSRSASLPATNVASKSLPDEDDHGDSELRPYARLRGEILTQVIGSGSLLSETSIAARYQISRTPAREALTRLDQDRLIIRAPRGYQVRTLTAEDVMELYEARIALESTVAASAALRRTDLDLARLEHLSLALASAATVTEITQANARWHEALWSAGHNSALMDLLQRVIAQMHLFDEEPVGTPPSVEETIAEHALIVRAVRAKDEAAARDALTQHLGRTRDVRLAALAQTPITRPS